MATCLGGSKNPYSFHMEGENVLEKEMGGSRLEKGKYPAYPAVGF